MRFRYICMVLLTIFSLTNFIVEATENLTQKVYISSADLQITDQGIYLYDPAHGYLQIEAVFFDNLGLYTIQLKRPDEEATNKCPNGHAIWCYNPYCRGCAFAWCKFRCKCAEWPFMVH